MQQRHDSRRHVRSLGCRNESGPRPCRSHRVRLRPQVSIYGHSGDRHPQTALQHGQQHPHGRRPGRGGRGATTMDGQAGRNGASTNGQRRTLGAVPTGTPAGKLLDRKNNPLPKLPQAKDGRYWPNRPKRGRQAAPKSGGQSRNGSTNNCESPAANKPGTAAVTQTFARETGKARQGAQHQ